jgi:hypothetical protein
MEMEMGQQWGWEVAFDVILEKSWEAVSSFSSSAASASEASWKGWDLFKLFVAWRVACFT